MSKREYPERPIVGVGVVILGPEGVLLIQRGKPPRAGSWSLPGGAQELGETVAEAALREVDEETGLKIELIGLVDVVDSLQNDAQGNLLYHYTLIDFVAVAKSGVARAGGDAADVRWAALDDIPGLGLWSETERIIARAAELRDSLAFAERRTD